MIPASTHRAQDAPSLPSCAQTGGRFLPRPPVDQFAGGLHVFRSFPTCAHRRGPLAGAGCDADRQLLSHDQPQRTDPSRIGEMRRFRSSQSSGVVGHEPQDRPLRRAGLFHRHCFILPSSLTGRGFGSGLFPGIGRGRANVPTSDADLGDLLAEADRLAAKVKAAKEALK